MYQQLDYQLSQVEMLRVTMTLQRQQNVSQQHIEEHSAYQGIQVQTMGQRGQSMMLFMRALPGLNKTIRRPLNSARLTGLH
eukprot:1773357-Karenia_brevis.AAC.1